LFEESWELKEKEKCLW